jgi:D-sedoheptulose 7-phosphate isomerase
MQEIASVESYFRLLSMTAGQLPFEAIEEVAATLVQAYESERTIYLFGNGGSAALASHMACDLGKGTVNGSKKRFRVMSLTSNEAMMTAWANDSNYHDIFAEQLANFVAPGDVAFAISCSGNSANVLNALRVARQARATTVGLAGFQGGEMKELCDQCLIVPSDNMQIIEDLHLCAAHAVFTAVRQKVCHTSSAASA